MSLNRVVTLLRGNVWGIADQGLMSGSNFVTMILLARGLSEEAFGVFTLAYSSIFVVQIFQTGLFTQPHNAFGPRHEGLAYVAYTTATAVSQLVFAAVCSLVVLGVAGVLWGKGVTYAPLLFVLAPAIFCWQCREFGRRVLFTEDRLGAVFAIDLVGYGVQGLIIAGLWRAGALTATNALFVVAATSFTASIIGYCLIRKSLGREVEWASIRENWHFGKWLVGGELGRWLSDGAYLFLSAALLGSFAAGILRIAGIIFGPLRVIMFFLYTIIPIRLSRALAREGQDALHGRVKLMHGLVIPVVGFYCGGVALFSKQILGVLFGDTYRAAAGVLVLYALSKFVGYSGQLVASVLKAEGRSRPIFVAQVSSGILILPLGWFLIRGLGVEGAVWSMTIAAFLVTGTLWYAFLQRPVANFQPAFSHADKEA